MCFDKTGTLTEEGLDTYGIISTNSHHSFSQLIPTEEIKSEETQK